MSVLALVLALLCALAAALIGFGHLDWSHPFGWLAAAVFFQTLAHLLPAFEARWLNRPR